MLLLWQMVDDRPFHKWNYLLAYVGLGCVAILVILIDSVLFSLLPVNFLMMHCSPNWVPLWELKNFLNGNSPPRRYNSAGEETPLLK